MTDFVIYALAAAFAVAFGAFGAAMAQGKATASAFDAIARQPQATSDIRTLLILALAFMEAICIFTLLIAFMLLGKIV